ILPEPLQYGGRPAFIARLVLAATASSSYGIYSPPFERMLSTPLKEGSEEYLNSEKYEIAFWDQNTPDICEFIALVNRIRNENPSLQSTFNLKLVEIENEYLIAYAKHDPESGNTIVVVVNLDFKYKQAGWLRLPLHEWGIAS